MQFRSIDATTIFSVSQTSGTITIIQNTDIIDVDENNNVIIKNSLRVDKTQSLIIGTVSKCSSLVLRYHDWHRIFLYVTLLIIRFFPYLKTKKLQIRHLVIQPSITCYCKRHSFRIWSSINTSHNR